MILCRCKVHPYTHIEPSWTFALFNVLRKEPDHAPIVSLCSFFLFSLYEPRKWGTNKSIPLPMGWSCSWCNMDQRRRNMHWRVQWNLIRIHTINIGGTRLVTGVSNKQNLHLLGLPWPPHIIHLIGTKYDVHLIGPTPSTLSQYAPSSHIAWCSFLYFFGYMATWPTEK